MAKAPAKKTARKAPAKPASDSQIQSGQEGPDATVAPRAARKAALEAQFAEADAKGSAELTAKELEAHQVGLEIRGY